MTKHAKGPWKVNMKIGALVSPRNANECSIEHTKPGFDCPECNSIDDEHQANAHLIAAAPEMLEALKEARDCLSNDPDTLITVEEVIKKAEGKE